MRLGSYMRGLGIGMVVTSLLMGIATTPQTLTDAQIRERAKKLGMVDEGDRTISETASFFGTPVADAVSADSAAGHAVDNTLTDILMEAKESVSDDRAVPELPEVSENAADNEAISADGSKAESSSEMKELSDKDDTSSAKAESSSRKKKDKDKDKDKDDSTGKKEDGASDKKDVASDKKDGASEKKKDDDGGSSEIKKKIDKADSSSEEKKKDTSAKKAATDGYVEVVIVTGDSSLDVAIKLQKAGLVSNAAEYDLFLVENGYDKRITTGHKQIPVGASKVEIAGIITVR